MVFKFLILVTLCLQAPSVSAHPVPKAAPSAVNPELLQEHLLSGEVAAGDTINLATGSFGRIVLHGHHFDPPIKVLGHDTTLAQLQIADSSGLWFKRLTVRPNADTKAGHLVRTEADSRAIQFDSIDVLSSDQADAFSDWSREDWLAAKRPGVLLLGKSSTIRDSRLIALSVAVASVGVGNRIEANLIDGFSNDGIRVLGDASSVVSNRIRNCVRVDDSHQDAIQSWSLGPEGAVGRGIVRGLRIEGNVVDEWVGDGPAAPRCFLQGIGLFDGVFQDLKIRNNRITTRALHGIAVFGGQNVWIEGNEVMPPSGLFARPWIGVFAHKNGSPATSIFLNRNVAPRYRGLSAPTIARGQNKIAPRQGR